MHNNSPPFFGHLVRFGTALPVLLCTILGACGGGTSDSPAAPAPAGPSAAARLGNQIFSDTALSESGQQSCASCHLARLAFTADPDVNGPDHGLPVAFGGADMRSAGFRNTPSLLYLSFSPSFFFDSDGGPNGGFFRDGRAGTLTDQAIAPFTNPIEMANSDAAAVIAKLKTRPYLAEFEALYGSSRAERS